MLVAHSGCCLTNCVLSGYLVSTAGRPETPDTEQWLNGDIKTSIAQPGQLISIAHQLKHWSGHDFTAASRQTIETGQIRVCTVGRHLTVDLIQDVLNDNTR